jgi:hypothetical protein
MGKRTLLVGQANAKSAPPGSRAFVGTDSWKRLARIAGVSVETLDMHFDTVNILPFHPGRTTGLKYDKVPPHATAVLYSAVLRQLVLEKGYDVVLTAGRWTSTTFADSFSDRAYFDAWDLPRNGEAVSVYPIPHPGGTNMHLNDRTLRSQFAHFLNERLKYAAPVSYRIDADYRQALVAAGLRSV